MCASDVPKHACVARCHHVVHQLLSLLLISFFSFFFVLFGVFVCLFFGGGGGGGHDDGLNISYVCIYDMVWYHIAAHRGGEDDQLARLRGPLDGGGDAGGPHPVR